MYGRGSFWRCSRFWRAWTEREQYSDPLQFQSRAQDRLTNVAVWIVNHLSEDLSVEHLAEKVNVCHDILTAYLKILSAIPPRISWKTPARRSTRLLGERAREIRRRSSDLIVRVSTQYYTLQTRPPERRRRRSASSLLARRRVLNVSVAVLCFVSLASSTVSASPETTESEVLVAHGVLSRNGKAGTVWICPALPSRHGTTDKQNRQYGRIGKTAPMPIGICTLCLLTKDLKESHRMPGSLYKR
jgi:hypothetical protein